jgi:hypothetical protein
MRIPRRRTGSGPLWAGLAFVLLAGILAMHGLASHDSAMRWMGGTAQPPAAAARGGGAMSMTSASAATTAAATVMDTASPKAGDRLTLTGTAAHHGVMDLCVAVLTLLLLLALARARQDSGALARLHRFTSRRAAAARAPPIQLRPSLTGLCIARV